MRQQPWRKPALERCQERGVGFVRACELLTLNHHVTESASDTPTNLGSFEGFWLRCFENYPTGVGFLLDL